MPEDKYEELKRVIQEVVPEIMEPKNGCLARFGKNDIRYIEEWSTPNEAYLVYKFSEMTAPKYARVEQKIEILGRPIRLADILAAMELFWDNNQSKDAWGEYWNKNMPGIVNAWNFSDDNLDNQSDETKEFLYNLLKK